MSRKKVFIIGLDGLDEALAIEMAQAGDMPYLSKLLASGVHAAVINSEGFEPGASWLDFYYGYSVATHGQFDGMQTLDKDSYRKRQMDYEELVCDAFWKLASAEGRRVAVIDAPYALLEPEINGIHVTDWLTHVFRTAEIHTNPPALGSRIVEAFGDSPFYRSKGCPTNTEPVETVDEILAFREKLITRIRQKTQYNLDAIRSESWDLFFTVYHDAHDVGHMGWHLHDPTHPRHDAGIAANTNDPVRDIYIVLDAAIGELLDAIPSDAVVLLYSNTGMGREISATGFLDVILKRLEASYSQPASAPSENAAELAAEDSGRSLLSAVYSNLVPKWVRQKVGQSRFMQRRCAKHHTYTRRRRRFMELAANHFTGGIQINLVGRQNYGIVENGREYQSLCQQLIGDIADIRNLDTGDPLVDSIRCTSEIHQGPMLYNLPDIIMEWNRSGPIRRVYSPRFGELVNEINRDRSGDHVNKNGFLVARIPDMQPSSIRDPVSAVDLAPTILSLLCVPNLISEGRVIVELTG